MNQSERQKLRINEAIFGKAGKDACDGGAEEKNRKFFDVAPNPVCPIDTRPSLLRRSFFCLWAREPIVRNGWSKERTIQTSSGNIKLKLPRIDDRKSFRKKQQQ